MKKNKKIIICLVAFIIISVSIFNDFSIAKANAVPVYFPTVLNLIFNLGATTDTYLDYKKVSAELSDEENLANAEHEQQYLEEMIEYYESYGGSPSKIAYMTADGSIVTLEETLQVVTSMDIDDYIEMRKNSSSPTPSPALTGVLFLSTVLQMDLWISWQTFLITRLS